MPSSHPPAARNALGGETSPYLLQHASNPVQWYPWGAEALELARSTDRPILLSIGYSACHWCHVMAHESFEDEATAALMNEHFVNIKVDREERPDLDRLYQLAHQLLTGRPGGWPLTVFLTPEDRIPFFAGTYFPRTPRHGLPAFAEVLRHIAAAYRDQRDRIREQNLALLEALRRLEPPGETPGQVFDSGPLHAARSQIEQLFDAAHGGFGPPPKFPHPAILQRLLRHRAACTQAGVEDRRALQMARLTLERMALGGLYDQLAGGFARYSVDAQWMIPHFEKMLYDNAALLALYAQAWQLTGVPLFKRVAEETAAWVMGEMQSPEGGYRSSVDADSEGEEGRYYLWTPQEVRACLDAEEYPLFARHFGLDRPANFEGRWHLYVAVSEGVLAQDFGLKEQRLAALLDSARRKLRTRRQGRVPPGRDDKVLTSWNALMAKGMVVAGLILGRPEYLASAERALDFIRRTMWAGGRLRASYKDGRARLNAYLDDYAFLIDALLSLLGARWRGTDLAFAVELAETLLAQFEDRERGGFFFTAHDHEPLIQRSRPFADESLPSGNGVAARVLGRLGWLLGEPRYLAAAERTLRAAWPHLEAAPLGHLTLLEALEESLDPPQVILLRGSGAELLDWQGRALRDYAPRRLVLAIPEDAQGLPEALALRAPRRGTVAYVCQGARCSAAIERLAEFEDLLRGGTRKPEHAPF